MEQTYQQVQEIRPYYVFNGVDVDRYTIDGVYTQVMLSPREMDIRRLPQQARAWVNERLQYTHGYGVAVSPVNQVSPEGLPEFLVRDIPPVGLSDLEVTQPEIYYGGMTYGTVAVKTATQEFDYPSGSENKQTTYAGDRGRRVGWFLQSSGFCHPIRGPEPRVDQLYASPVTPDVSSTDRGAGAESGALPTL